MRLRSVLKGDVIDESFLAPSEQLLLIEERVSFILAERVYLELDSNADQVRVHLEISDLELELRQLRRQPVLAMDEWVMEYSLYPLLRCMVFAPASREAAVETFRLVCSIMETSGKFAREVPVYLSGLDVALATNDVAQAENTIMRGLIRVT